MSPRKGLTAEKAEEIRSILMEQKRIIEGEIRKGLSRVLEETAEETTVVGVDEGGDSRVDVGKEMSFEVLSRRSEELKRINEALERLMSGEYGICGECGNQIRFERLKVMPFAQLCRNCQQDSEQREKERLRGGRRAYDE